MKHNRFSQYQNQKPVVVSPPAAAANSNQNKIDFTPLPDDVAMKAYFSYLNQGSPEGHAVQHWLEAEAQLIAERNLKRVNGFQNRT